MAVNLKDLTIVEAGRLLKAKDISPVDLISASLERIQHLNPLLNAYVTVMTDSALEEAHRAEGDIQQGRYKGPLHGIPVSVKDIFCTRGTRTTGGEKKFDAFIPDYDATVVSHLKEAGAILVGKALPMYGEFFPEPAYGFCRNPWDLERIPGYSSSGGAAAVAVGADLASIGSDGGGSIRYPAACAGVVGLKPTFGRVSRHGSMVVGIPNDYTGPLTRTAADCALVLQTIAGYDPQDPFSAQVPVPDYSAALDRNVKGVRIGVPTEHFWDFLDPQVERGVREAIKVLESLECEVEEVSLPTMLRVNDIHWMLSVAETAAYFQPQLEDWPEEHSDILMDRVQQGLKVMATDYIRASETRGRLLHELDDVFRQVDILLTPTSILPAPVLGQFNFHLYGREWDLGDLASRLTRPFNTSGNPAVSVPCGFTPEGLPLAFQLAGDNFDETVILRVADAYQRATNWHNRRPPL
jgi:aspartyl-tRNA(Asn)/glutamyl-tRNA(Gln) amidotransferase subunit A